MSFAMLWPVALLVFSNTIYQICAKAIPGDIHPLAALSITYGVATIASIVLFFILNRGESTLFEEYQNLNWSSFVLGLCIVGLELGFIFLYKAGWPISTGNLVASALLAVVLILVGVLFYKETLTLSKGLGIAICMVGLFFINR